MKHNRWQDKNLAFFLKKKEKNSQNKEYMGIKNQEHELKWTN